MRADPPIDEELWEAATRGVESAFAALFERYADQVCNFVYRATGSWDLAEELVSVVFLEAWRQREKIHLHHGSLRPWLLGVASNQVRRWWRDRARRDRAVARLHAYPLGDHADAVSELLDDEQRLQAVLGLIDGLPDTQREALILWAWEGLNYAEIAVALGVPVGTVRSRLSRARAYLTGLDGTGLPNRASNVTSPNGECGEPVGPTAAKQGDRHGPN